MGAHNGDQTNLAALAAQNVKGETGLFIDIAHREVPIPLTQSLWSRILSAGKCAL